MLYAHFLKEKQMGHLYQSIQEPEKRAIAALGLDRKSFSRWMKQNCGYAKATVQQRRKVCVDDFDKGVIRREILKMFQYNELVTLRKLKSRLLSHCDIEISKTNLWKIVRGAGFTFRKTTGGRNLVCEKPNLVTSRSIYLRKIRQLREDGYDIVYLDESWINAHHTVDKEWQSVDRVKRRTIPSSKGQRLILAHAGSRENGLLQGAELIFHSKSTDGVDYHKEMNACIFRDWLENTVLTILDKPSCIVMDNASYHNVVALEDKIPISSSTKEEMKTWLIKENVTFDNNCLKPELLQIVRQTKRTKVYQIDKIILEHGHTSLRLPPYHPQLNPIELVWAKVKGRVAEKNTTFKMCDVQNLTREAISTINKEYWRKCEDHVLREEDGYWQRDGLQFVQPTALVNILDTSESD